MTYPDLLGLPMHPWPAATLRDVPAFVHSPRYRSICRAQLAAFHRYLAEFEFEFNGDTDDMMAVTEKQPVLRLR